MRPNFSSREDDKQKFRQAGGLPSEGKIAVSEGWAPAQPKKFVASAFSRRKDAKQSVGLNPDATGKTGKEKKGVRSNPTLHAKIRRLKLALRKVIIKYGLKPVA